MRKENRSRFDKIIQYLKTNGFSTAKSLSASLNVSVSTIQRDLIKMEHEGLINRKHGGAMLPSNLTFYPLFHNRVSKNIDGKVNIGKKAADFIHNGECVFIASGSTCLSLYASIERDNVTVFTNSISIAAETNPHCTTYMLEGLVEPNNMDVYGSLLIENLDRINPDKLLFSSVGMSIDGKILCYKETDRGILSKLNSMSGKKYYLIDSSKFGTNGAFTPMHIESVDVIITDKGIPEEYKKMIETKGVELVIV